ncbi:zinc ABC transporter substrate-binding protein [Apilactobacillus apisilvae]|uniref:Zinc ABC transporter substrate-binding protein n=1 Tax=Apilactobacillus apisilvae TaxID=2923364 RepID=A0ABY4PH25_9LACO|nr:zinc ABC transporter substrate-binding protein [Apilactobacillus apisilvae]UQS84840.1 zinc ABC transporter substrate-binding protein [Apilactobacillus apisilvae]
MHKFKKISFLIFLGSIIFILTGCNSQSNNPKKSINVTTSLNFYGEVAKDVLGNHGTVNSIINNPNVDPHDFEPKSSDAKNVSKTNIMVYNGLGYDSWAESLTSNNSNIKNINVGALMGKRDGDNPHIWYNTDTMKALAYDLAKQFSKLQPENKKAFEQNAQEYVNKLKPIDNTIKDIKKSKTNKPVAVSEPVFDYSLEKFGYKIADKNFESAIEKDNDPAPKDIRQLQNDIKDHKLAFFVVNKQVNSKIVTNLAELAKQNNVPIVKVTETKPDNDKTYLEWMNNQYRQVLNIQKNHSLK